MAKFYPTISANDIQAFGASYAMTMLGMVVPKSNLVRAVPANPAEGQQSSRVMPFTIFEGNYIPNVNRIRILETQYSDKSVTLNFTNKFFKGDVCVITHNVFLEGEGDQAPFQKDETSQDNQISELADIHEMSSLCSKLMSGFRIWVTAPSTSTYIPNGRVVVGAGFLKRDQTRNYRQTDDIPLSGVWKWINVRNQQYQAI